MHEGRGPAVDALHRTVACSCAGIGHAQFGDPAAVSIEAGQCDLLLILALQGVGLAWIVSVAEPSTPFTSLLLPMMLAGTGMGLVFAPASAVVLQSVHAHDRERASGANSTVREIGGALGIAILASVFTRGGSYASPQAFVDGMRPEVWVAVVLAGAAVGLMIPRRPTPLTSAEPADSHPFGALKPSAEVTSRATVAS